MGGQHSSAMLLAVGVGAMAPPTRSISLPGYRGLFDERGALIKDIEEHVAAGKPAFSQINNRINNPLKYHTTPYGQYPKHLYHGTTKKAARAIANEKAIDESCESGGDAFLGDGVYMTAIPVDWADPDVVKRNNYGLMSKQFRYWNKANAFIRVDFEPLFAQDWAEIKYKTDWQSNFCIKVPRGQLYLTKEINAKIAWDQDNEYWDWEAAPWKP